MVCDFVTTCKLKRRCMVNSIYEIFSLASSFLMLFIEFTISRQMYCILFSWLLCFHYMHSQNTYARCYFAAASCRIGLYSWKEPWRGHVLNKVFCNKLVYIGLSFLYFLRSNIHIEFVCYSYASIQLVSNI